MPRRVRDEDDFDQGDQPRGPSAGRVALAGAASVLAAAATATVAFTGWELMARNERARAAIAKLEAEKATLAAAAAAPRLREAEPPPRRTGEPAAPPANPRGETMRPAQPPRQERATAAGPPEAEKPPAAKIDRRRAAMPTRPVSLNPKTLTVGDVGKLDTQTVEGVDSFVEAYYVIDRILGDDEMIVSPTRRGFTPHQFVVRRPTAGLAENRKVRFQGYWEVAETKKVGGRTYYVVEQVPQ